MTWGYGMVCAAILLASGESVKSFLLPLVVVQMQLIEGLRWLNVVDERILAVAGKLNLFLQPIAAMIEGGIGTPWIALYAVTQVIAEVIAGQRDLRFTVAEDGHFKWNWIMDPTEFEWAMLPYQIALAISTFVLFPTWVWALGWGLFAYYFLAHRSYGTYGSLWCVSANFLWIYYLLR